MPLAPWRLRYFIRKWKKSLYDPDITERFAEAIRTSDIVTVNEMYRDPALKMRINPFYQDADGNSLMHLAVRQGQWVYVTPVKNLGCPNNIENNERKMPFDIVPTYNRRPFFKTAVTNGYPYARPAPGPYSSTGGKVATRDAFVEEMSDYYRENFSGAIYPGRRVTSDLNLYFECNEGRCELPDSWPELDAIDTRRLSLHQRLAIANHLSSARAESVEEMKPDSTSNCYVTAALTFVVSAKPYADDTPVAMRAIIIPINLPKYVVYSIGDAYAHAEQMLFAHIKADGTFDAIVAKLKEQIGGADGHKCYAAIFDLHTTYNMCGSCEKRMYDFQGPRGSDKLLIKCETALEAAAFILPTEKRHPDLLTPLTSRLSTSTRVSCHASFPHDEPKDNRGHKYRSFEGASVIERNVARHRSAVVFHSNYSVHEDRRRYKFSSKKRGNFVPSFVPKQTAFVMKPDPDSSCDRRSLSRPAKHRDTANPGIFIHNDKHSMKCHFRAKEHLVWQYVQSGEIDIVKRLIIEKLGDRKALAIMLTSTHDGQNIFHKAIASNNIDMLDYVDMVLSAHFSAERETLVQAEPCLLSIADSPDIFLRLLEFGAKDEQGEYAGLVFDEFDIADKEKIVEVYTEKGWEIEFAADFLVSSCLRMQPNRKSNLDKVPK